MMYDKRKYTEEEIEYAREDYMTDKEDEVAEEPKVISINLAPAKKNSCNIMPKHSIDITPTQSMEDNFNGVSMNGVENKSKGSHDDYIFKLRDDAMRTSIMLIFGYIKNKIENKYQHIFVPDKACWLILEYYYVAFMVHDYRKIKIISKIDGGELIKITPKSNFRSRQSRTRSRQSSLRFYKMKGKYFLMEVRTKRYLLENQNVRYRMFEKRKLLEGVSKHSLYIMKLHYAFQTKHKLHLVYNYYIGGSLRNALNINHKFEENVVQIWIASIISAVGYLHEYGIFYLDLNPRHIHLDESGHCHLTNVIPKSFKYLKSNHIKQGKSGENLAYYAPEIIQNGSNKTYNKSVDWWSVGIILFELITGYTPFYDDNIDKMYKDINKGIFNANEKCPSFMSKECKDLCSKLLVKNIENRLGANNEINENYVLKHSFFKSLSISKLERKEIASLYVPKNIDKDDENQQLLADTIDFDNDQLSNYGDTFVKFNDFVL